MTAKELASQINMSSVSLYNIINGKQEASANTLNLIASVLNVPFWQLFVSLEDVKPNSTAPTILCPHCHHPIELEVKERKGIGDVRDAGNSGGLADAENV